MVLLGLNELKIWPKEGRYNGRLRWWMIEIKNEIVFYIPCSSLPERPLLVISVL